MLSDQLDVAPGANEPKFYVSRVVLVVVVVAFAGGSLLSVRGDLAQMSFAPLWQSWNVALLAVALTLLNYTVRVTRWRWYLVRLGHGIPLGFAVSTYIAGFAFTLSPGKLGELLRARYYSAVGVPLRDVMAAFWVERLMDLLALFVLALLLFRAHPHYRGMMWVAGIVIALGTAIVTLLPAERAARYVKASPLVPRCFRQAIGHVLSSMGSARTLLCTWTVIGGFLMALVAWGLEGAGLGVLGSIFSPLHHDALLAVGVYAIAVLVGALSFLPGGVGGTEAVMTALLVNQGYTVSTALLTTLACRLTTLWLGVCLGWLSIAMLRHRLQSQQRTTRGGYATWPREP
jgi:uncharacterized protein (TIRG00374 family)